MEEQTEVMLTSIDLTQQSDTVTGGWGVCTSVNQRSLQRMENSNNTSKATAISEGDDGLIVKNMVHHNMNL